MEVNNYQPSFKAGKFLQCADYILSKRMASGKYVNLRENFMNRYKDSDIDVEIGIAAKNSIRLTAIIRYRNAFRRYVEETIFASIFKGPAKFIEKVNNIVEKEVLPTVK